MEHDGRANGEDTTHGGEFLNPLVKKKPSKSRLPTEKYGPWMLVTRKPKRPTQKPKAHQSANRYPEKQVCMPDRMSYQQEMPNTSCYAHMEDDGIRKDLPPTQGENPSGTPVHAGPQRKQHNPRMNVKEPLSNPDNSGYTRRHYIAPQNANKSRGGRGNLPRRAAAETKHTEPVRRFNHDAVTENSNRISEDHEESGVHEEVTQTQVSGGQVSNHGSPQNHTDQPPIRRSARLRTVPPRLQDYYCQSLMEDKSISSEAWALLKAIQFAQALGDRRTILEDDSIEIIEGITISRRIDMLADNILSACKREILKIESWKIEHIAREQNKLADGTQSW
nr:F-box/kelch-repeat protein At1g80440-like [Ipomoea batatas]